MKLAEILTNGGNSGERFWLSGDIAPAFLWKEKKNAGAMYSNSGTYLLLKLYFPFLLEMRQDYLSGAFRRQV